MWKGSVSYLHLDLSLAEVWHGNRLRSSEKGLPLVPQVNYVALDILLPLKVKQLADR